MTRRGTEGLIRPHANSNRLEEALLMQTDRATCYVSHNLVNCRNNLYTTDQQQFEVMDLEGYS